jgi:acid stress-induced BolA-like protein IbaG/YrbA
LVYACVNHWLESGELHAVTMQTWTPDEFSSQL